MEFLKKIGKAFLITAGIFVTIFLLGMPFFLMDSGYVVLGFIILFLYVFMAVLGVIICKH